MHDFRLRNAVPTKPSPSAVFDFKEMREARSASAALPETALKLTHSVFHSAMMTAADVNAPASTTESQTRWYRSVGVLARRIASLVAPRAAYMVARCFNRSSGAG